MTQSYIAVRLNDEGDLVMEGQDLGAAPLAAFGESEYEYFVTVRREHKDALLMQPVRDRFLSEPMPSSTFMEYLKETKVPYEFFSC